MIDSLNQSDCFLFAAETTTGFDAGRWDHWLLVVCFGAIAFWGLWLSWQWNREAKEKKAAAKLSLRLMRELHGSARRSSPADSTKPSSFYERN